MSTAIINYEMWRDVAMNKCIQNALDDLDSLPQTFGESFSWMINELKNFCRLIRILYACGRKWGKDALSSTLEINIYQHSLDLQSVCLTFLESEVSVEDTYRFPFYAMRNAILGDMEELHQILSTDDSLERISTSHIENMEDLLVIIDSLLHLSNSKPDLEKSIRFLKDFIGFVRLRGLEAKQMGDLLMHVPGVLVDTACFFFRTLNEPWKDYDPYKLIDRIVPLESEVCEIYVGVLQKVLGLPDSSSYSILAPGSHTPLLADFVDSLLFLLRHLFFRLTPGRLYHPHIYKLNQGLRLLRTTTLAEQDDKIDGLDKKRHDLLQVLICEAGVTVCYLFHVEKQAILGEKLEHLFLNLDAKFKLLKPEEEVPSYQLPSECPKTNLLGFIDSLLAKINSANLFEAANFSSDSKMNKLHTIHEDLAYLRSFLTNVMGQQDQNGNLQVLWSQVATVAYETEFVFDSLLVGDTHESLIVPIGAITSESEQIKTETLAIFNNTGQLIELQRTTKIDNKKPLVSKVLDEPIVGLDDELKKIINRLNRGPKKLDVVSIVGMAGLGKTTLAKKVYRDPSISVHFHVQLWCTVSQGRDKKSLLLEILGKSSVDERKSDDDLGDELRRYLKGKRYLVILDDVWDTELWSGLRIYFPCDDGKGSRILVTTRSDNVAATFRIRQDSQPHYLRFLTNDESWKLFRKKMCFEEDCPPELCARGEAILICCKGLPLMIIVVAGILSNMEPCKWEEIEKSIKKGNLPTTDECKEIIELSYRYLPDYLKPCFLCFGAYKEDQKVRVWELLWLWIAEGFVKKTEKEHELEDVAKDYMMELIQINLIIVAERGSRGQVKYCILHDVLLDLCKRKCKQEHFLHSLHRHELGYSTPLPPRVLYRLHVMPESRVEDFAESTQLFPHLRTLLFHDDCKRSQDPQMYDILYNICQSKLLRVLVLNKVFEFRFFPNAILHLGHLRYLALAFDMHMRVNIPSSIGLLSNLETFILLGYAYVSAWLPDVVWNMKKLRHLKALRWEFVWKLAAENPNHLDNLHTLSRVVIHDDQEMQQLMWKFPNICRLKCGLKFDRDQAGPLKILALDLLSQLESLHIYRHDNYVYQFQFPKSLKKLTLSYLELPWNEISAIDRLPNLEVLKLLWDSFSGETWHVGVGEYTTTTFPKLRFLKLERLDIARWRVDPEDSFPCLQMLVLEWCVELKELPIDFLLQSTTLQLIEVIGCSKVAHSIKNIEETKTEWGNEYPKILIKETKKRT